MTQAILKHVVDGLMCRAANMKDKRCEYCPYGVMLGNSGWDCDLVTMCRDAIELLAEWRKAAETQMETLKALEDVQAYAKERGIWWMESVAVMAAFQICVLSEMVAALKEGGEVTG